MTCKQCPLSDDSISGPIRGRWVGPENGSPTLMVIGESPTLMDDQKGKVFTGKRGHLIDDVIRTVLPSARVYYMNLLKCRVVNPEDVTTDLINLCSPQLGSIVKKVDPLCILSLGNTVLKYLSGKSGILKYRGKELQYEGYKLIPTLSPGAVLRSPKYSNMFQADILKACSTSSSNFEYIYVPVKTRDDFRDLIKHLRDLKNHNKLQYITLDFETTTFDYWRPETKILTIGICADGKHCFGIPVDHPHSPWRGQGKTLMKFLKPFLCDPQIPVVGNNWKYDQKWSRAKLGTTINFGPDNMLMSYANDENSPHGLKYQADLYCNAGPYDQEIVWPTIFDPVKHNIEDKVEEYCHLNLSKLLKYNALDAFYSWHVYPQEKQRLELDSRTSKIYHHLLEAGSHMFVRIEEQGMWVDPDRLDKARKLCQKNLDLVEAKLNSLIPPGWIQRNLSPKQQKQGFNWRSVKQLGLLFFQEDGFNFPTLQKTGKGSPSTSEATIINLSAEINHPVLEHLLDFRKWSKYMSTYLLPWSVKVDKNSRLHPNFKLHGTVTGRLSGEDGVHQVPRDKFIRSLIGAPPGWSFLEIDGSQIELRVAATIADESTMLRIYATGGDIHRTTAAAVSGKSPEQITGDERKKAKAVNFGFLYGMGWKKFKIYAWEKYGIRLSDEEAKHFRSRFFELYHELPGWHNRTRSLVRKLGYVISPIGRKRRLPDIYSSDEGVQAAAEREAINSPVQGFGSDYVLAAFIDIFHRILEEDPNFETIRPVGTVHDAQYYEIRNDKLEYWATTIKKLFDDGSRLKEWFNYELPILIPGDIKVGTHWGDAKDWTPGEPLPFEMR